MSDRYTNPGQKPDASVAPHRYTNDAQADSAMNAGLSRLEAGWNRGAQPEPPGLGERVSTGIVNAVRKTVKGVGSGLRDVGAGYLPGAPGSPSKRKR